MRMLLLAAFLTACVATATPVPTQVSETPVPEETIFSTAPAAAAITAEPENTIVSTIPATGMITTIPEQNIISTAPTSTIITAMPGKTIISIDTIDKIERLVSLTGHSHRVTDVAFSPDGNYLASSGRDGKIRLWDTTTWQEIYSFDIDLPEINVIAFSPDGKLLAAGETIWNVESKQAVHQLGHSGEVSHVAFSPDGSLLAVAGFPATVKLWDVASGEVVRTLEQQPDYLGFFSIMFSPDGKQLAGGGADNGSVTLWEVASGQINGALEYGNFSDVHDLAFSPDGSLLAGGGTGTSVRIWDVDSGEVFKKLSISNGIYGLAFSPDGSILALASCNRVAQLWDVMNGQVLRSLPHADELYAVTFSPDGSLLATGGYDNTVVVWGIAR